MKLIQLTPEYIDALPKTREEAIAVGQKCFYSKIPCKNSHVPVRLVAGGQCLLCKRERTRLAAEKRRRQQCIQKKKTLSPLLTGNTYGSLVATGGFKKQASTGRKLNRTLSYHEVRCQCGVTFWIRSDQWGKTESCLSCKQARVAYKHGLSRKIEMWLWEAAKQRARKSGVPFTIRITDIKIPERCPILGVLIDVRTRASSSRKPRDNAPSLDRLDSGRGYTPDNVFVMSYRANILKKDGTAEEHAKVADFMVAMGVKDGS